MSNLYINPNKFFDRRQDVERINDVAVIIFRFIYPINAISHTDYTLSI